LAGFRSGKKEISWGKQGLPMEALLFFGFIEIVPHSLFVRIRIQMAAFVFFPTAAPADIIPAHYGLLLFGDFVPAEQTFQ
jgi:hypothetical protein